MKFTGPEDLYIVKGNVVNKLVKPGQVVKLVKDCVFYNLVKTVSNEKTFIKKSDLIKVESYVRKQSPPQIKTKRIKK